MVHEMSRILSVPVLSSLPPKGSGWIHEIKHGFRTLLRIDHGKGQAFTRNGHDWSEEHGRVISACHKLRCRSALIDGEIIVQDENGVSDYAASRIRIIRFGLNGPTGTIHIASERISALVKSTGDWVGNCPKYRH
jgi:hypothetical protein